MATMKVACRTDAGMKMARNEDAVVQIADVPLYGLADGTGGEAAGRLVVEALGAGADRLAREVRRVADDVTSVARLGVARVLEAILDDASRKLMEVGERERLPTFAASAIVATTVGPFCYVAHVGDCRAYLWRDQELRCLTTDHTLAMMQLQRGVITFNEYLTSPFRHTLSKALGLVPQVNADIAEVRWSPGDVLLLCTNGLTRVVSEERMTHALMGGDLDGSARDLVEATRQAGAPDNVSVLLLQFGEEAGSDVTEPTVPNVAEVLRAVPFFRELSEPQWLALAPYLEEATFEPGAVLYRDGDAADTLYVVASGQVRLTRDGAPLRELGPGGHCGALALTTEVRRFETATAVDRVVTLALTRARFQEAVRTKPSLGVRLTLALLAETGGELAQLRSTMLATERMLRGRS